MSFPNQEYLMPLELHADVESLLGLFYYSDFNSREESFSKIVTIADGNLFRFGSLFKNNSDLEWRISETDLLDSILTLCCKCLLAWELN